MSWRIPIGPSISLVLVLALNACAPSEGTIAYQQTATPIPGGSSTVVVTPLGPGATSFSRVTLTPTATSTHVPALSAQDARRAVAALLENPECRLPCWWGLIPGQSSPTKAYEILLPLRNIAYDANLFPVAGSISLSYPLDGVSADIRIDYQPEAAKDAIKLIQVDTQAWREGANLEDMHAEAGYHELLRNYSLQSLLSQYGPPSQVLVRADIIQLDYTPSPANDLSRETFEVTLLYPAQGIFVRYNMLAERVGDQIRGCPAKAFVELWLLSPDEKDSYDKTLSSMDMTWEGNWPYSKPVQEVTEMSLDEFYQTFSNPTDQCIETPLNIWPGH